MRATKTLTALTIALGLTLGGATAANAAPPKKPGAVTWTCKAGEIATIVSSYGNTWKACINTTTKKVRLIGWW